MTGTNSSPATAGTALERRDDDPAGKLANSRNGRPDDSVVSANAAIVEPLENGNRLGIPGTHGESERRGCEPQIVFDAPRSTVASHGRTLRGAGSVRVRTGGTCRHYRIADTAVVDVLNVVRADQEGN